MRLRRTLLLIFLLLAGVVMGALVAELCSKIYVLSWLGFSQSIGISPEHPFVLDLSIFQFSFSFLTDISVAQVLTLAIAIVLYNVIIRRK